MCAVVFRMRRKIFLMAWSKCTCQHCCLTKCPSMHPSWCTVIAASDKCAWCKCRELLSKPLSKKPIFGHSRWLMASMCNCIQKYGAILLLLQVHMMFKIQVTACMPSSDSHDANSLAERYWLMLNSKSRCSPQGRSWDIETLLQLQHCVSFILLHFRSSWSLIHYCINLRCWGSQCQGKQLRKSATDLTK